MGKVKLSKISVLHYFRFIYRSLLLVAGIVIYAINRSEEPYLPSENFGISPWLLGIIWISFAVEMVLRFFPSKFESMGSQKQFEHNYIPTNESTPKRSPKGSVLTIVIFWSVLNGIIGILSFNKVIDEGILLIIALIYSVCDMICILYYCPFQTLLLKNKCCGSCRIYNWDYAMMFTPLLFLQGYYRLYGWTLLGIAVILLLRWEVVLKKHPKRFFENTNDALACKNCSERLCNHKKQLHIFWKSNRFNNTGKSQYIDNKVVSQSKSIYQKSEHNK